MVELVKGPPRLDRNIYKMGPKPFGIHQLSIERYRFDTPFRSDMRFNFVHV